MKWLPMFAACGLGMDWSATSLFDGQLGREIVELDSTIGVSRYYRQ